MNNNDLVPKFPPYILGYKHVGRELQFNHRGILTTPSGSLSKIFYSITARVRSIENLGLDYLLDHDKNKYLKLVHKNIRVIPAF